MEIVAKVVEMGRAIRSKAGIKVRQPLAHVAVYGMGPQAARALQRFAGLVKEELNVKSIEVLEDGSALFDMRSALDIAAAGAAFGGRLPAIRAGLAAADQREVARLQAAGKPVPLNLEGEPWRSIRNSSG